MFPHHHSSKVQNPVDQPSFIDGKKAVHTEISPIPGIPQPNEYVTRLDPVFVQHLSRHQGERMAVMTIVGRIEGVLAGVAVDHIQINLEDRSLHIRISQIVYFEGPLASYR